MNNSWNIKGDAQTYKKYDKGWADEEQPKKDLRQPPQPVLRSGQASRDNPLVQNPDLFKPVNSASRSGLSKVMYSGPPVDKEQQIQQNKQLQKIAREQMPPRNPY